MSGRGDKREKGLYKRRGEHMRGGGGGGKGGGGG